MMNYIALFWVSVCFGLNLFNWVSGTSRHFITKFFTIGGLLGMIVMLYVIHN